MHGLSMDRSRTVLAVALLLAGLVLATPSRAAMPTLAPQVQAYVAHAQPLLAITHVRVIDGHGTGAREHQTVLLRDGRIAAVGRHVDVPKDATVPFLRTLPVGALWGVGERTEAALARWGVRTVAELADSDVGTIQRAVGRTAGAHLYDLSWGRDPRPVEPGRDEKSIDAEVTFPVDVSDPVVVQAKALELADRCAGRLRAQGLVARTIAVKVRTSDFRTLTRSRTLVTPTDVGREVYLAARELLAGVDLGGLPVRLVGVRAEGLSAAASTIRQPTLDEVSGDGEGSQRDAERAMDRVRERFGAASIGAAATAGRVARCPTTDFARRDLS